MKTIIDWLAKLICWSLFVSLAFSFANAIAPYDACKTNGSKYLPATIIVCFLNKKVETK